MSEIDTLQPGQRNAALVFKDYHLGLLAQIAELEHRLRVTTRDLNNETQRLQEEMTRAYLAETRIAELEREMGEVRTLRAQLKEVHESMTWRVGRFIMFPLRLARRALGR